jgi:hypothetical protein
MDLYRARNRCRWLEVLGSEDQKVGTSRSPELRPRCANKLPLTELWSEAKEKFPSNEETDAITQWINLYLQLLNPAWRMLRRNSGTKDRFCASRSPVPYEQSASPETLGKLNRIKILGESFGHNTCWWWSILLLLICMYQCFLLDSPPPWLKSLSAKQPSRRMSGFHTRASVHAQFR